MPAVCRDGEEGEVLGGVVLEEVLDRVEGEEDLGRADAHGHFQEELEGAGDDFLVLTPVLEVVADLGREEGRKGGSEGGRMSLLKTARHAVLMWQDGGGRKENH